MPGIFWKSHPTEFPRWSPTDCAGTVPKDALCCWESLLSQICRLASLLLFLRVARRRWGSARFSSSGTHLAGDWVDELGSWAYSQALWAEWYLGKTAVGPLPSMTFTAVHIRLCAFSSLPSPSGFLTLHQPGAIICCFILLYLLLLCGEVHSIVCPRM